jgi:hypothetical protein
LIVALVLLFEFGRAFWAFDVVTRDVRAGVRYLTRNSATPPPYSLDACPASAQNVVQTGLPGVSADANKHFPWKGATATFVCSSEAFSGADYNDAGRVVTMTATVPITLSLISIINNLLGLSGGSQVAGNYSLNVSYQSRYIGN